MDHESRRKEILDILSQSQEPVTGTQLAQKFHVTRQIIVKDIALIRAEGNRIISTARGYCLQKDNRKVFRRTIKVSHSTENIEHELQIIVDLGGKALNTKVVHPAYGELGEALNVRSRKDIQLFLAKIKESGCEPLLALTNGVHMHDIEADSQERLDEICSELKTAGYLISD